MLLEQLRRVPKRNDEHPLANDKDYGWIYKGDGAASTDALSVVRAILGPDNVFTDTHDGEPPGDVPPTGVYVYQTDVGRGATFTTVGAPGTGGAIALEDMHGTSPQAIASAAHEAFHALLYRRYKNTQNEKLVNKLALRWLQDHFSGKFLHFATERILRSNRSYSHRPKSLPSRKWAADGWKDDLDN